MRGKANKVSNTERKYTMKSNLLKKIAGWVIMVFFGMTILTGCDDYNFDIPLTPFLLLDSYNVNFDQNSGERILEVRCNEEWTVELSKELQGWCSVTRNEDDNLIVSVILSEDKYVRRGEFYVKAFSQTDTVRVAQLGYQQAILVSPQNMNIDAAGDKVLVEVTSNVDYIITLPDWIIKETQPDTRAPQETVTKQYLFKIESNKGAKRMGEIVFADSDEMSDLEPTVINVVQKGLVNPCFTMSTYSHVIGKCTDKDTRIVAYKKEMSQDERLMQTV